MSTRVGVIGAGANSRLRHIPGFQEIDGVEVVAVANRSSASAKEVASTFGISSFTDDWKSVAQDPDIDAVCIGTWPNMHCEATLECLQHGKHVLCEARMARDLGEALKMADCAKRHPDLVTQIVPSPFTLGDDDWIRERIEEEILGDLLEVRVRFLNGALCSDQAPMNWRLDQELSGKNTMVLGILHEAILRWIPLPGLRVSAAAGWGCAERPGAGGDRYPVVIPESLQIAAHPSSGPRMLYDLSQLHAGANENRIEICGKRGTLIVNIAESRIDLTVDDQEPVSRKIVDAWDVEGEFIRSIREGTPVKRTSFEEGLKYMAFTEAVWESWSKGLPVEVGDSDLAGEIK